MTRADYVSPVLDPRLGRGPGLARLRAHPDAERIRLGVVDKQRTALARAGSERKQEIMRATDEETKDLEAAVVAPATDQTTAAPAAPTAPAAPKEAKKGRFTGRTKEQAAAAKKGAKPSAEKKPAEKKPAAEKKTAAKKAEKKPKAEKKAKSAGGSRTKYEDGAKILIKVEGNPRKAGSKKHAIFELIRACKGQTVKTYREKGGKDAYLRRAVKKGHVEVTSPAK